MISVYYIYSIRCSFTENTRIPTCLCLLFGFGEMSNKSRSSSKRASKASKQSGLLETLTRVGKRTAVVDEEDQATRTVIELDSDDPVSQQGTNNYLV